VDLVDGRYRVERPVGAGGMGAVFRAHDERTDRPVALKVLDVRSPVEIERAHREAEVLARLDHPAIVGHVGDGITADNKLYLAMEWVDGVTVADRLAGDGLTVREAIAVAERVASALAAAHDAGILHRDIKPSNVILEHGDPSRAKLIDFGIARISDPVKSLTRTGLAIGTPGYMSPEQARGERHLTPASDVFGLGCLLYECATAQPAFSGTVAAAVLIKIVLADPAPLVRFCHEASPALQSLVERMLHKDPRQRPAQCAAIATELAALGNIADGPRRTERSILSEPTAVLPIAHVLVVAARGPLGDIVPPPPPEQCRELVACAERWNGSLEILANGALATHFVGTPEDATRGAGAFALVLRAMLPGWSIAISGGGDPGECAETGTALLSHAVLAQIFRKPPDGPPIVIDRGIASLLDDEFELDLAGDRPRLLGRRASRTP
jgi:hypothetical protein